MALPGKAHGERRNDPSSASPWRRSISKLRVPIAAALLCLIAVLVVRGGARFQWSRLAHTMEHLSAPLLLGAAASIYVGYILRALRWNLLLPAGARSDERRAQALATLPPQVIGFTATALFGRIADLVRPWLIARRLGTSLATQLAVYSIERVLDLAAAAAIIASPLLYAPSLQHAALARTSAAALIGVVLLGGASIAVRLFGEQLAALLERLLGRVSVSFARKIAAAMRDFQVALQGLSAGRLGTASALSLLMWAGIALSYTLSARACLSVPELRSLTFANTMPVLAASLGGSLLQLPMLGWLTQVGVLAAALHGTAQAPLESATACGVLIVAVTTLSVIPAGLIAAQRSGIRLRDVSGEAREAA